MDSFAIRETVGDWREDRFDDVVEHILRKAGSPDLNALEHEAESTREFFDELSPECSLTFRGRLADSRVTSSYRIDVIVARHLDSCRDRSTFAERATLRLVTRTTLETSHDC